MIEINGTQFNTVGMKRSQRRALREKGLDLTKKTGEFYTVTQSMKEGDPLDFQKLPLSESDIDLLIDTAFPGEEHQAALEECSVMEQMSLAFDLFMSIIEGPSKNS